MKKIPLTQNKFTIVDDEDFEWINQYKWSVSSTGYAKTTSKSIYLHRMIMRALKGESVDHINHEKLDNRKSNLRICTHQQNLSNQSIGKNNKSGYKGVYWSKGEKKWVAQICINGKTFRLGRYNSPEEAARKYNTSAILRWGEFSQVNQIPGGIYPWV